MDPIAKEFNDDLERILGQVLLIDLLASFAAYETPYIDDESFDFFHCASNVQSTIRTNHANFPIARGTLVLYTCGRFESMVRTMFEDLCQRLVSNAKEYKHLPRKMQENLPLYTAKVIAEPRKYGHAENGVRTFVSTLAKNLQPNAAVEEVNHQCLSITDANMKSEVLAELFGRVGAVDVWKLVAQQLPMRTFFKEADIGTVESKAKKALNDLMEMRNRIAHPSGGFDWPSSEYIRDTISFLKILAKVLGEIMDMYELTLCTNAQPAA